MIIAERIYRGETADQVGITPTEYAGREAVLARFLGQWAGGGNFEQDYLGWLAEQTEGERDNQWTPAQASRGFGDTIAKITTAIGIKPCGGCKGRQKTLNKLIPYKIDRV